MSNTPAVISALPTTGIASALALMTDEDITRQVDLMVRSISIVKRVKLALLEQNVDYGTIGNVDKQILFKSGAQKLALAFRMRTEFRPEITYGDGETAPAVSVVVRALVHDGDMNGPVIAEGLGAAHTWEVKYRYRNLERTCPICNVPAIMKSRNEPGWFCWRRNGGCGQNFMVDDRRITEQITGKVTNPDQADLANTVLKMAEKRAEVDAIIRATGSSGLFTQDLDEEGEEAAAATRPEPEAAPELTMAQRAVMVTEQLKAFKADKPRAEFAALLAKEHGVTKITAANLSEKEVLVASLEQWLANGAELPGPASAGIDEAAAIIDGEIESPPAMPDPVNEYGEEPFVFRLDETVPAPLRRSVREAIQ